MPIVEELSPEVLILVCERVCDDGALARLDLDADFGACAWFVSI